MRRAARKGGFAAARLSRALKLFDRRALAGSGLRGRSAVFRETRNQGHQPRKGPAAPARAPANTMDTTEIEDLRERVRCPALLEKEGWKLDIRESTRRALKYRRDADIIIVIHEGHGWFDPLSAAKGDVFSLAEHLGAEDFVTALERVGDLVGFVPVAPGWRRPLKVVPLASIAIRWRSRPPPYPGSPVWRYLTETRMLPADVVRAAVDAGALREGPRGSLWAAHIDLDGNLTGWEERGPAWRGFATGGAKGLFRLGSKRAPRICITEAAIDALSLAAIEAGRDDAAYVSTGGGWSPATEEAIRAFGRGKSSLIAATDNDRQGENYASRIRAIAEATSTAYARSRPRLSDWNEELKLLVRRPNRGSA